MGQEHIDIIDDTTTDSNLNAKVILWNDDVNTFSHVINTLMEVCTHTSQQAEQCALLVHMKGKANVKSGEFQEMLDIKDKLISRELSATVEF